MKRCAMATVFEGAVVGLRFCIRHVFVAPRKELGHIKVGIGLTPFTPT